MKSVDLWWAAGLLALVLAGCTQPAATVWNKPNLDKCQKGIETSISQLDGSLFLALKSCKDAYRTAMLKGKPLETAALTCDSKLQKALLFPDGSGKSALAKTKAKLDLLVATGKCTDENLLALGHLPQASSGDLWERLLLVQRLKAVIEEQVLLVRDTVNIFQQLGSTGKCPTCAQVANPPCFTRTCSLSPASSLQMSMGGDPPSLYGPIPLGGTISLAVCDMPGILGNNFAVSAGPAQTTLVDLGGVFACVKLLAIEGYIEQAGSVTASVASANTCQDHIVNSPDSDECPAFLGAGALCASAQADSVHAGVTNGGACLGLVAGASTAGSSFALATLQTTLGASDACVPGNAGLTGPSLTIPLTTGTASETLIDLGNTNTAPNTFTVGSGSVFTPAQVAIGSLSGGTWVGAAPGLHVSGDAGMVYTLACQ